MEVLGELLVARVLRVQVLLVLPQLGPLLGVVGLGCRFYILSLHLQRFPVVAVVELLVQILRGRVVRMIALLLRLAVVGGLLLFFAQAL